MNQFPSDTATQPLSSTKTNYLLLYSSIEMWWHTVTHGRGSEGETGEWNE